MAPRFLLAVFACVLAVRTPVGSQGAGAPRLTVILVVDQMRTDYLQTFAHRWRGGIRVLLDEGAFFEQAEYPYLNTVTCAGHATIGTGTFPHTHGMILNGWWDRERRAQVTCAGDEEATHVTYGRRALSGSSAKRLLVNTLGDELRAQRPGARVVTLSLKPRSAIGLAGHGGDAVTWFDDAAGAFVTSRAFAAKPVKAVADFIRRNPHEAGAGQTWTLQDRPETYRFPDATVGARPPAGWTGLFPHIIAGRKGADAQFHELWQASPLSDAYLGRLAAAQMDAFALGRDDTTDFLGVSFSALDLVGHDFGPDSREVEDLLLRLDTTIGALVQALDARVGRERYTLALTSDHGVAPIPRGGESARIAVEDIRERIEETLVQQFGPRARGRYVEAAVFTNIYLASDVVDRVRTTPAAYRAIERAVLEIPGVERVIRGDDLSTSATDRVIRAATLSHMPSRSGDLIVIPRASWFLGPRADAAATTHGSLHEYDRRVPLILFGAGVKPGRFRDSASPADIAPTLAHLAGVRLSGAEGRILREGLHEAPREPRP
jgi:predicted AlkP superfamily pyrophosphatase or phosphodiesterase